ncbi:hypothetical protein [Ruegeria aquimaris]|uniref:Bacterial bifunctional deaminase-reductase C-terminal domain-containing protein n=1 Tax=Ruegeria aquimaris TaxID=2984333 RepID=A0ABT3ARC2_9RHOB|nr:hypothetical protein [Ruegeria sp. XHP0148]MCV2891240.1 hypothetical protein [Ruegeria sp. XHP0148]
MNDIPLTAYLPLNAVPWFDGCRSDIKDGAAYNRELVLRHRVPVVLACGSWVRDSLKYLNLPSDIVVRVLPHPGQLGLINYRVDGRRVGPEPAREIFIEGFRHG